MLFFIIMSILSTQVASEFSLEKGMKRLYPEIKESRVKMIAEVIRTKAHKYGLKKSDYPTIIAMAMSESTFTHVKGSSGEVGILQVIPRENHIRRIVAKYIKCNPKEKYCKKNGRPDIYGRRGRLLAYKAYRFLWEHPHYAFEAGLGEMVFWRNRWRKSLKRRFWTYFPSKHYKRRFKKDYVTVELKLRRWWRDAKRRGKGLLWVSSYNWGGSMGKYIRARSYPMKVLKHYNIALGRKPRSVYVPYIPVVVVVNKVDVDAKVVNSTEVKPVPAHGANN